MTNLKAYAQSGAITLSAAAMADAMDAAENAMRTGSGGEAGVEYVSFSGKTGQITFGRDKEDLDEDEQFMLDPRSFSVGWVCWVNNSPVARHEWSIFEPHNAVRADELADHGPYRRQQDGWQAAAGFGFVAEGGETKYKFSSNSKSGKNAISDILGEVKQRLRAGEPAFPLFRFTKEKFFAQGEWNYKPAFLIDEWLDEEEANEFANAGEMAAAKAAPEPEPEPEEAPKPRRTRRA
jgi:hypothetical protein